jgi:hypothetical protein
MVLMSPTADLRYPIGRPTLSDQLSEEQREAYIADIAALPEQVEAAVAGLTPDQLDTPYRPKGWTVRQLVHHVADSHLNAYTRFKLAFTEENPTIKPYDEKAWANLADSALPIDSSILILRSLHERWTVVLGAAAPEEFARTLVHPENGVLTIDRMLGIYAWHGKHHTAHILNLRERMGW